MHIPKHACMAALLLLLGSPGLDAQEEGAHPINFKIRVGLVGGDLQQAHYDNKVMGFGAEYRRELKGLFGGGLNGAFAAELAWEYVPGRHHDIYPWGENPLARIDGTPLNIRYSFDNRKEYGQGLNLKLAYYSQMPQMFGAFVDEAAKDMEWFAGLSLDRYKVRSEVKYTLIFSNNLPPGRGESDGGTFVQEGSQLVPGAFVGVRYYVRKEIGIELALRNFGLWHLGYVPAAYHAGGYNLDYAEYGLDGDPNFNRYGDPYQNSYSRATSSTGTSRGWALDFAITAKL